MDGVGRLLFVECHTDLVALQDSVLKANDFIERIKRKKSDDDQRRERIEHGVAEGRARERGNHGERGEHVALRVAGVGQQQFAREPARRAPLLRPPPLMVMAGIPKAMGRFASVLEAPVLAVQPITFSAAIAVCTMGYLQPSSPVRRVSREIAISGPRATSGRRADCPAAAWRADCAGPGRR